MAIRESRKGRGSTAGADAAEGIAVEARTQGQLIRRRFLRHRAAVAGMVVFASVVVLAFSSIGFGPVPGWWGKPFTATGAVLEGGRPTLSVLPTFLGGNGFRIGEYPFGQDNVGRDYFAVTMRGAQRSLIIALTVGVVSTTTGSVVGALAGFYRGRVEAVLMRLTDVIIAIPLLVFAAVLGRMVAGANIWLLGIVLGLATWTQTARLVRGEFLSLREKEFVEAARAAGTSARRIIFKHIMPNAVGVIIVSVTLATAVAILLESALSFLGLGVQPPDTSLGSIISEYRSAMNTRPWLFWWPGMFIIAIALSVNFIGDGLRDAFDPRQTKVRT